MKKKNNHQKKNSNSRLLGFKFEKEPASFFNCFDLNVKFQFESSQINEYVKL